MSTETPEHPARPEPRFDQVLEAARDIAASGEADLAWRRMRLLRRFALRVSPDRRARVTAGCETVARTAARLAQLMRLPEAEVARARLTGLLHDLGALTPESDGAEGSAILCGALGADAALRRAVAQRDRRFDEPGKHETAARVLVVARAMCTGDEERSCARSLEGVLAELRRGRGAVYDPDVVVAAHLLGASIMSLAA